MSRLSTLFILGGAGLLLTPVAASAQHIRAFGLPHGRPPLTVPIVPPISVVPTVRIVPPVPLVRPVIGFPHGHFVYTTQYHLGNLSFNTTTVAFGAAAWAFRPYVPVYLDTGAYGSTAGAGSNNTASIATAYNKLAQAQREATQVATWNTGPRDPIPVVALPGAAEEVRRALAPADAARIASGEALNEVVREIARAESKGAKVPSAYIPPLLAKDIRFAGSPAADLLNFVRQSSLEVPAALDNPTLAARRTELVTAFAAVADTLRTGKVPDAEGVFRLDAAFQKFEQASAPVVKDLSFEDAAEARRFLNRMSSAIKALKTGAAKGLVDPTWAVEGLTGAELVKHVTKHKLEFGPAPHGATEAYETIHRNLAAYLFALSQPKKK